MRSLPLAAFLALLPSLAPVSVAAQDTAAAPRAARVDSQPAREAVSAPTLVPGARVRARVGREWRAGRLVQLGPDTLWLGGGDRAVALQDATRLEVRRRATRGEGARRWALRGLVGGLAFSGVLCGAAWAGGDSEGCGWNGETALGFTLLGGGGAFYGALGGALFRGHRWQGVTLSAPR